MKDARPCQLLVPAATAGSFCEVMFG